MKELLLWLYGKSARNAHIRDMAEKTIVLLKEKGSMEYQELAQALGIEFNQYKKPKRTFYFVINPLKKIQLIQDKRIFADKSRKKYKTVYFFNPDAFYGYMKRILDDFYSNVKPI
jgi:predicted transcriptional regulator